MTKAATELDLSSSVHYGELLPTVEDLVSGKH